MKPAKEKENEEEEKDHISWSQSVYYLEQFLKIAESNPNFSVSKVLGFHIKMKEMYKKCYHAFKQNYICDLFRKMIECSAEVKTPEIEDPRPGPSTAPGLQTPCSLKTVTNSVSE